MFNNVFNGLYLVDVDGGMAEVEEVAQEDRLGLLVNRLRKLFKLIIVGCAGGQL